MEFSTLKFITIAREHDGGVTFHLWLVTKKPVWSQCCQLWIFLFWQIRIRKIDKLGITDLGGRNYMHIWTNSTISILANLYKVDNTVKSKSILLKSVMNEVTYYRKSPFCKFFDGWWIWMNIFCKRNTQGLEPTVIGLLGWAPYWLSYWGSLVGKSKITSSDF